CNYGIKFGASLKKDNFMGCQFHPEKSGLAGEKLLRNFLKMK
ncbi:MAG: imidazole glycerol phosphate synthase subunit HisH, partial [Bacteroidales bacterium]|nr:imidazole glycerol phosphate synthase subunit HisH [Bacteroidales bacterium]